MATRIRATTEHGKQIEQGGLLRAAKAEKLLEDNAADTALAQSVGDATTRAILLRVLERERMILRRVSG